ncbi:hypothetical protein ABBQ32_004119 [Trebouxia sp. C0010 RCD-2024]
MAGKKAAEKSDTQVAEKPADKEEVPKKRGRPAKNAVDKASEKPKQAASEPVKGTEAAQEGKRPRGRPPGETALSETSYISSLGDEALFLPTGTGKKQKAAAEAAAAKDAIKNEVRQHCN